MPLAQYNVEYSDFLTCLSYRALSIPSWSVLGKKKWIKIINKTKLVEGQKCKECETTALLNQRPIKCLNCTNENQSKLSFFPMYFYSQATLLHPLRSLWILMCMQLQMLFQKWRLAVFFFLQKGFHKWHRSFAGWLQGGITPYRASCCCSKMR